ncbi:MAG: hypothetical protein AAFV53_20075 [Myxococcota bacterium]
MLQTAPRPLTVLTILAGAIISIATSPPPPTMEANQSAPLEDIDAAEEGMVACLTVSIAPNAALQRIEAFWNVSLRYDVENRSTSRGELSVWPVEGCDAPFTPDPEAFAEDAMQLDRGTPDAPWQSTANLYISLDAEALDTPQRFAVYLTGSAAPRLSSGELQVSVSSYEEDIQGAPDFTLEVW